MNDTTWAEMPTPRREAPRGVASRAARVIVPFVIGAGLVLLGLTIAGILVFSAACVLLALTFLAPAAALRAGAWLELLPQVSLRFTRGYSRVFPPGRLR